LADAARGAGCHRAHLNQEDAMTIIVNSHNVSAAAVVQAELADASGAHVEVVLLMGTQPPIHHAFDFQAGTVTVPVPELKKGKHTCTLIVHAFKHKHSLNKSYQVGLQVGGKLAATAKGNIPAGRSNDIGSGDFTLTVT
jgi:hypothetical protein